MVEKLLRITYNTLGVRLTGTLQVYNGFARSKAKEREVRKNIFTRASHPGESIFVYMAGPFPEMMIRNQYWIGVVDDCIRYSWIFFMKTKS